MAFSRKRSIAAPRRRQLDDREARESAGTTSQFRRNRTLSGPRTSYEGATSSQRSRTHHLTLRRRKVGGIFLLVLTVILILTILLFQFTARVIVNRSSQQISQTLEGEPYQRIITDYFGSHPVERLRFLLNEQSLSEYATSQAPEVEAVIQGTAQDIIETNFTMTFRRPIAGWQINGKQFYVDGHGVVFEKNYYEDPGVQIVDQSGISPEQGSTVASARLLSFVGKVVAQSRAGGYAVTEAILPSGTTRQLEIRLQDVKPRVKFSIDRGAGEQAEDMVRALKYLSSRGVAPEYVDVRVSGRAIYQ